VDEIMSINTRKERKKHQSVKIIEINQKAKINARSKIAKTNKPHLRVSLCILGVKNQKNM
jgi:hypothetical protein